MEAQDAVYKLEEHLLGRGWYASDWENNATANQRIVNEIIGRYKGVTESPVNKWRRKHRRCEFCKHCVLGSRDICEPKNKFVNSRAPRPFCACFQLKPYKEKVDE